MSAPTRLFMLAQWLSVAAMATLAGTASAQQDPTPAPAPDQTHIQSSNLTPPEEPVPPAPATDASQIGGTADPAKSGDVKADVPAGSQQIQLNGIVVQGKHNPIEDSDKRLKQLQDSLPCTGCDAKAPTHKKLVSRVLDAVGQRITPTEAPDHSGRDANDKAEEYSKENACDAGNVGGCIPPNARP